MRRTSFSDKNCSVAQALEIVGEWWTLLILRDAFLGVTRFDTFQGRLGIARNVLTTRLDGLVEAGVFEQHPYDESRGRVDYVLTDKGRALWPVLSALRHWGDEWLGAEDARPLDVVHRPCGASAGLDHVCRSCGEVVDVSALEARPGPGAIGDELPERR